MEALSGVHPLIFWPFALAAFALVLAGAQAIIDWYYRREKEAAIRALPRRRNR